MDPNDLKYFLEQLKLVFSSLFARQMAYVIFGCPKLKDNELLFSNVDAVAIEIYENDPEFYFHKVTIHDQRFLDLLYQQYPILKSHVICMDAKAFMSAVNKSTKSLIESKLSLAEQDLLFECQEISVPCGQMISEFTANHYYDIFLSGLPDGEDPYTIQLQLDQIDPTKITYLDIENHGGQIIHEILHSRCMLLQGKNIISTKEYIPKSKISEYTLQLTAGGTKQALKVSVMFCNKLLSVVSSQPGIRYYVR
nr:MAG TPA: hypothetical protein [Bacteriophage sp.]